MRNLILTITPNPTLDVSGEVQSVVPNEKMYVQNERRNPGGGGINVARILTRLKVPVIASGFIGGGTGNEITVMLETEKIRNMFVRIRGHSRTSLTISNRQDHNQTRFSFPGPAVRTGEIGLLFDQVKHTTAQIIMIGGSLPREMHPQDILSLCRIANKRKIPFAIDSRPKVVRRALKANPLLIKPNLLEFQELVGTHAETLASVYRKARGLSENCPFVCVSSVEDGALLITRTGTYFGRIPQIKIRSTIGAGDSLVAAMLSQMVNQNFSGEDLLRWGLAASAATLQHYGTELGAREEIRKLYCSTRVEKIR